MTRLSPNSRIIRLFLLIACLVLAGPVVPNSQADTSWLERRAFSFAKRAFQDSLYDVAQGKLVRFLEKYPESDFKSEAVWLLGQSQFFMGDPTAALKTFTPQTPPADAELAAQYQFWRAECLNALGRHQAAADTYQELIKSNPPAKVMISARLGLSRARFNLGNHEEARKALVPLLSNSEDPAAQAAARLQEARIAAGSGKSEEARGILNSPGMSSLTGNAKYEAAFLAGELYHQSGNFPSALTEYQKITGDPLAQPRRLVVRAWHAIGQVRAAQEKWAEASDAFEKAFRGALDSQQIQESVQAYLHAEYKNQTLTKAALEVRNFVAQKPDVAVSGLYAIGNYFFLEKKYDAAITELDHLLKAYPDSPWAWSAQLTIAEALLRQNQAEAGLSALEKLASESPLPDIRARAWTRIGEERHRAGHFAEAADAFAKAAENSPDNERETLLARQLFSLARQGDPTAFLKADEDFQTMFPNSPHRFDLLLEKARLLESSGKDAEARDLYSQLVRQQLAPGRTAEALYRLGLSGFDSGKTADALTAFAAIEANHPDFQYLDDASLRRIQCEHLLGARPSPDIQRSVLAWLEKFPESPRRADARIFLGSLLDGQGLFAEASAQYRQVLNDVPGTTAADQSAYWGGKALFELKQYADATALFERVRDASPWKPHARLNQILCAMKLGDYAAGLKIATSVLETTQDPSVRSFALLRQAECMFTLAGEDRSLYPRALAAAEQVIAMESAHSSERNEAGFIKGEIHQKLNQSDKALEAFLNVVYGQLLPEETTQISSQPEIHWFIRSGLAAARIKESQGDIAGAVEIYRILERLGEPGRREFRRKIEDLKNEHFLFETT